MLNSSVIHIILTFIYIIFIIQNKKQIDWRKQVVYFAFFVYVNLVIAITLFPIPMQKELIRDMQQETFMKNSFVPFKDIVAILRKEPLYVTIKQIIGNIVMFMPMGYFIPIIFRKTKSIGQIFKKILVLSILIETLQLGISKIIGVQYKITSVDDIILNTIGGLLGFILFKVTKPLINNYFKKAIEFKG